MSDYVELCQTGRLILGKCVCSHHQRQHAQGCNHTDKNTCGCPGIGGCSAIVDEGGKECECTLFDRVQLCPFFSQSMGIPLRVSPLADPRGGAQSAALTNVMIPAICQREACALWDEIYGMCSQKLIGRNMAAVGKVADIQGFGHGV